MIPLSTPVRWSQYTGRVVEIVPALTAPANFKAPGRLGLRPRVSYVVEVGGTRYWPEASKLRVVGTALRKSRKGERGAVSVTAGFYDRLEAYAGYRGESVSSIVEGRLVAMLDARDAAVRS